MTTTTFTDARRRRTTMASSSAVTITAVDTLRAECTRQMRVVRHCPPETPNHKPGERVVRAREIRFDDSTIIARLWRALAMMRGRKRVRLGD